MIKKGVLFSGRAYYYIMLTGVFLFINTLCGYSQTFPCDSANRLYFFQDIGITGTGYLSYITGYPSSPTVTQLFPMPTQNHNALAANPLDNYLYYLDDFSLNRLDALGNVTTVCTLPFSSLYGCFDLWGRYWTIENGTDLVAIDINTCSIVKGPFPISGSGGMVDIVFNPFDCMLYVLDVRCDTSGVVDGTYSGTIFTPSGTYGGVAIGNDGNLYGLAGSGLGNMSTINLSSNTSQNVFNFSPGPTFGNSDMASFTCFQANAAFAAIAPTSCGSLNYNFLNQSSGTVATYTWNFGDPASAPNNNSSLQNPSHIFSAPGTYTVTLSVSSGTKLCFTLQDTAALVINVTASSYSVSFQTTATSCNTNTGSAGATISGGSPPYSYLWSNGQTTTNATGLSAGNYTVTITDGSGCTTTSTVAISQPTILSTSTIITSASCSSSNGTAIINPSGGILPYTYSWSNGQTSQTATGLTAGTYTATVTDANGCSVADAVTITSGSITATAGPNSTICSGSNASLTASGGMSYSWSSGQTISSITITPTATTNYSVIVSSGSCADTAFSIVTVSSSPVISVSGNTTLCTGDVATLTASGGNSYLWSNGNTNSTINISPSANTTYSVTASNGSCISITSISLMVAPPPIALATGMTVCAGQNAVLTASGGTNYSWSNGATTSSITATATATYSVIVSIGSCSDTASASVVVNPTPTVSVSGNVTITAGNSATLSASGGGNYLWSNGGSSSSITVSAPATTMYCVYVSNSFNCVDTNCIIVTVVVEPLDCSSAITGELFFPNVFSPNGDNENDVIKIYYGNYACIKSFEVFIYNRWGERVFETTDPIAAWDGSFRGKAVGPAVFTYYMKVTLIDGDEIVKRGNISLIK